MRARLFAATEAPEWQGAAIDGVQDFCFQDFCFNAFSRREPASTPHQLRGGLSLETTLVESALMAQAHHFLDKDRLLLVVEAGE